MKKLILMFLFVMASSTAVAAGYSSVIGTKIGAVRVTSNGTLYVFFEGGTFTPGNCLYPKATTSRHYMVTGTGKKEIYATALAAMHSGASVQIFGSEGACNGNYDTISYMSVSPNPNYQY